MLNKIKIDKIRRELFFNNELNYIILKFLSHNENYIFDKRWIFNLKLSKLKKNSNICRIHDFCIITGRSKSIIKFFKISRIIFRSKASFHELLGLKKSSW